MNPTPEIDYKYNEVIETNAFPQGPFVACTLTGLSAALAFRMLYIYFEPDISPAAGDFSITAEVKMFKGSEQKGHLPASLAYDTNGRLTNSRFSVFGNSQTGGSWPALLGNGTPFDTTTRRLALTPFPCVSEADQIIFRVTGKDVLQGSTSTFTGYRCFIGVVMSNYKFW